MFALGGRIAKQVLMIMFNRMAIGYKPVLRQKSVERPVLCVARGCLIAEVSRGAAGFVVTRRRRTPCNAGSAFNVLTAFAGAATLVALAGAAALAIVVVALEGAAALAIVVPRLLPRSITNLVSERYHTGATARCILTVAWLALVA